VICAFNHRQYFKQRLLAWRRQLLIEVELFFADLKEHDTRAADIIDQSNVQTELFIDSGKRDRQNKLLHEIDLALDRLEAGEYGYCEITGEEIGLKRLDARPVATRCIEAQERFERMENGRSRPAAVW
jgi:DnaK suppressor protein